MSSGMNNREKTTEFVKKLLSQSLGITGNFAEFGIYKAETFIFLAEMAHLCGQWAYAFDSFCGMGEEGPNDLPGKYPKGRYDIGGTKVFSKIMTEKFGEKWIDFVYLHSGWIPDVFVGVKHNPRFSFAHVDLDQYQPTLDTLNWLKDKMLPGGIITCHDYNRTYAEKGQLAAGAVRLFLDENGIKEEGCEYSEIWWKV